MGTGTFPGSTNDTFTGSMVFSAYQGSTSITLGTISGGNTLTVLNPSQPSGSNAQKFYLDCAASFGNANQFLVQGYVSGALDQSGWAWDIYDSSGTVISSGTGSYIGVDCSSPSQPLPVSSLDASGFNFTTLYIKSALGWIEATKQTIPVSAPIQQTVVHPASTSFTVLSNGFTITSYQWQVLLGGTWTNITAAGTALYSGYTTATLTIGLTSVALNGTQYRCSTSAGNSTVSTLVVS